MDVEMTDSGSATVKPLSKYITLVSNDGFEFVVLREAALLSGVIKRMLGTDEEGGGLFKEAKDGRCEFGEINGVILEKVAEYLYYNIKNRDVSNVPDMDIPLEHCLELLMAADYLDV